MDTMVGADLGDIREGNLCLLSVMDQHFMVEILKVAKDFVDVSFPGVDYPVDGMAVDLEFHDKLGFNSYHAVVVQSPKNNAGRIRLTRPPGCVRAQHRDSCRVPTDLTVQVKDQAHVRRYDAALLNLSGGGALLRTEASFEFDASVELTVSLPGEPTHTFLGQVVHISRPRDLKSNRTLYGIRFVSLDMPAAESATRYIWRRLRELYPIE